jgi:hypothetical protein
MLEVEDSVNHRILVTKTDLRWLSSHQSKITLLRTTGDDSTEGSTSRFFYDILEFERVLCRCGMIGGGIEREQWHPISHHRHVSFCNTTYLALSIQEMRRNQLLFLQTAFRCLTTLTELQIVCSDEDIVAPSLVASCTCMVPSLTAIRFASMESSVSDLLVTI